MSDLVMSSSQGEIPAYNAAEWMIVHTRGSEKYLARMEYGKDAVITALDHGRAIACLEVFVLNCSPQYVQTREGLQMVVPSAIRPMDYTSKVVRTLLQASLVIFLSDMDESDQIVLMKEKAIAELHMKNMQADRSRIAQPGAGAGPRIVL